MKVTPIEQNPANRFLQIIKATGFIPNEFLVHPWGKYLDRAAKPMSRLSRRARPRRCAESVACVEPERGTAVLSETSASSPTATMFCPDGPTWSPTAMRRDVSTFAEALRHLVERREMPILMRSCDREPFYLHLETLSGPDVVRMLHKQDRKLLGVETPSAYERKLDGVTGDSVNEPGVVSAKPFDGLATFACRCGRLAVFRVTGEGIRLAGEPL